MSQSINCQIYSKRQKEIDVSAVSSGGRFIATVVNSPLSYGVRQTLQPKSFLGKLVCNISAVAIGILLTPLIIPKLGWTLSLSKALPIGIYRVGLRVLSYVFFKYFSPTPILPLDVSKASLQSLKDSDLVYNDSYYAQNPKQWDKLSLKKQIAWNQIFLAKKQSFLLFTRFESDEDLTKEEFVFFMQRTQNNISSEKEKLRNQLLYDYGFAPDKPILKRECLPDLEFDIDVATLSEGDLVWYYYAFKMNPDLLSTLSLDVKKDFAQYLYADKIFLQLLDVETKDLKPFWKHLSFYDQIFWNLYFKEKSQDLLPHHFNKEEVERIHEEQLSFEAWHYVEEYCKKDKKFAQFYCGFPFGYTKISDSLANR